VESHHNSSGRKLEFERVRRYRGNKKKNREAEERGSRKAR